MKHWSEYRFHIPKIQGKRNKYDNTIYTFDIETTSYLILDNKITSLSASIETFSELYGKLSVLPKR